MLSGKRPFLTTNVRVGAVIALALHLAMPAAQADATAAQKRYVDRMTILISEQNDLTYRLKVASALPPDIEEIKALERSLEALNKEIAFVRKQPIREDGWSGGVKTAKPERVKPVKSPHAESFEAWDIFRNFGRTENENTKTE